MNDILPPKRPLSDVQRPNRLSTPPRQARLSPPVEPDPLMIDPAPTQLLLEKPKRKSIKRIVWLSITTLLVICILAVGSIYVWYRGALRPVSDGAAQKTRIQIVEGSSPSNIGK